MEHRHQDNEGRCSEGPASADDCPGVELIVVKDVNGEHGSRPDDNKENCEADSCNVGGDLGGSELSDDNLKWGSVMEVFNIIKIQFSLVFGNPWTERIVNVSGLLPLFLLNLRSHVPPCDESNNNGEHCSHSNSCDVSKQHGQFLTSVLDKGCSRETSFKSACHGQPDRHACNSSTHHSTYDSIAGGSSPQDGNSNRHNGGGNEDASEVVGPGEVQVNCPAEEAQGDGKEGCEDNTPVLVVEQMFLILFVVLVNSTAVMRLDYIPTLSPDDGIFLQNKEC